MKKYNCEPTLTDTQVLEFCKNGFLMLEGVVPEEINRRTFDFVEAHEHIMPSEILREDWFVQNVILNSAVTGAVRSLLGRDFSLPNLMANHRVTGALPAQVWHRDGGSIHEPNLRYLQVFYYPQECTVDMGPTELLPGSHFLFSLPPFMGHYDKVRGSYLAAAPSGSVFITVYSIWHRRSKGRVNGTRNLLKYVYWRTTPPQRDWVVEPDFDFATADYGLQGTTFRPQFWDMYHASEMFYWLCGRSSEFKLEGGQAWPLTIANHRFIDLPYGVPEKS